MLFLIVYSGEIETFYYLINLLNLNGKIQFDTFSSNTIVPSSNNLILIRIALPNESTR